MISNEFEVQKLVEVSKMYYEENKTQDEISKILKVSRPLVSKMLAKARSIGIVNIQIKNPYENNSILMRQLENIFNLKGGIIVPKANTEYLTEKVMFEHVFNFINDMLPQVRKIGIGWGNNINNLVKRFETEEGVNSCYGEICPLIGSLNLSIRAYHTNEMVRIIADKTGLKPHYIYAPAFPETEQEKNLYENTDYYKGIEELWSKLDTAVVSIENYPSVPDQCTATRFGKKLTEEKAVGEIVSNFYNRHGKVINSDNDYALKISLEQLRHIKNVIGICSSNTNINSIIGALRSGFISYIIIDEETAANLIKYR